MGVGDEVVAQQVRCGGGGVSAAVAGGVVPIARVRRKRRRDRTAPSGSRQPAPAAGTTSRRGPGDMAAASRGGSYWHRAAAARARPAQRPARHGLRARPRACGMHRSTMHRDAGTGCGDGDGAGRAAPQPAGSCSRASMRSRTRMMACCIVSSMLALFSSLLRRSLIRLSMSPRTSPMSRGCASSEPLIGEVRRGLLGGGVRETFQVGVAARRSRLMRSASRSCESWAAMAASWASIASRRRVVALRCRPGRTAAEALVGKLRGQAW